MNTSFAIRSDVEALAQNMRERLPIIADQPNSPSSATGRPEWTRAVWQFFNEEYRIKHNWTLYPDSKPVKGRVAGEFMADFALFDDLRGFRIACESEWGDINRIDWAFDKLRAVKAEIKILIFEWPHDLSDQLPHEVLERIKPYLCQCGHHHVNHEFYLFFQFQGSDPKVFIWEPTELGPINPNEFRPPTLL